MWYIELSSLYIQLYINTQIQLLYRLTFPKLRILLNMLMLEVKLDGDEIFQSVFSP